MQQATLLNFGIAADIIGHRKMTIELKEGWTVEDLRTHLSEKYPRLKELASLRFAINDEYADESATIVHGDEVVLIPPVSGG